MDYIQQQVFSRDNSHTGDVHMVEITPDVKQRSYYCVLRSGYTLAVDVQ